MGDSSKSMRFETDVAIIGAGPVALFAAFECGHLGMSCHLIDSMPIAGGQCAELYPGKPIFDIPGIPVCTGQELVDGLMKQASPFDPVFHLDQQATELRRCDDGRWSVTTRAGLQIIAPSVVVAAGVGSFEPRQLPLRGADEYSGTSIHYAIKDREIFRDRDVVVAGGGDSALDWVLELNSVARSIVLLHRRKDFRAAPNTVSRVTRLVQSGAIRLLIGKPTELHGKAARLSSVSVMSSVETTAVPCDDLLVFYGLRPSLGPLKNWGLNLDRNQLPVNTATFETAEQGIFAIGDIASYEGKLKLLLSGFHEAALMAQKAFAYANPDTPLVFRHTTSNADLQRLVSAA